MEHVVHQHVCHLVKESNVIGAHVGHLAQVFHAAGGLGQSLSVPKEDQGSDHLQGSASEEKAGRPWPVEEGTQRKGRERLRRVSQITQGR